MGRLFFVFLLGFVLGFAAFSLPRSSFDPNTTFLQTSPTPSPTPTALPHLPDLTILPPTEVVITRPRTGVKLLRFDTTTMNIGQGPFEIIGHNDTERERTFASQYIKMSDGTGKYKEVGAFVYHPTHRHWHIENYVEYQLWTLTGENQPDREVARSEKISSCLWDIRAHDTSLANAPQTRVYTSACNRTAQGISVGWSDIYNVWFEGQEMDISSVEDGTYLLTFTVNPDGVFDEQTMDNNRGSVRLEITGSRARLVQ